MKWPKLGFCQFRENFLLWKLPCAFPMHTLIWKQQRRSEEMQAQHGEYLNISGTKSYDAFSDEA